MSVVLSVRVDDAMLAALDGRRGDASRSEYAKALLGSALGLKGEVSERKALPLERHPVVSVVLAAVREKPGSARQIAARLGLDRGIVERAEAQMSKAGLVRYGAEGTMEAVE